MVGVHVAGCVTGCDSGVPQLACAGEKKIHKAKLRQESLFPTLNFNGLFQHARLGCVTGCAVT